jgi:hypothetical protein
MASPLELGMTCCSGDGLGMLQHVNIGAIGYNGRNNKDLGRLPLQEEKLDGPQQARKLLWATPDYIILGPLMTYITNDLDQTTIGSLRHSVNDSCVLTEEEYSCAPDRVIPPGLSVVGNYNCQTGADKGFRISLAL